MKILLVSANPARAPFPVYPLGMGIVARALLSAGHEVWQYDFLGAGLSMEKLLLQLREINPELIGISIRNIDNINSLKIEGYIDLVHDIVAGLRTVSRVPIVLGGAGFSIMPEVILNAVGADYGIAGEAEVSVLDLAACIGRGEKPPQRIYYQGALTASDIGRAEYDPDIMRYYVKQGGGTGSVQTKRGCARRCVYCTYPLLEGQTLRPRDPTEVVDDIERLVADHSVRQVFFTDSVFNDERGYFLDVLNELKRRAMFVPWSCFINPGHIQHEHVRLMKDTGLRSVEIGADAASDIALKGLRKDFLFKDVLRANEVFIKNGISISNSLMFGGPGETRDSVLEGIGNVLRLHGVAVYVYMGIRIFPGTPLEKIALREGVVKPGDDLLRPVYYFAPSLDRVWLEQALTAGFQGHRQVFFPVNKYESVVGFFHKMGF